MEYIDCGKNKFFYTIKRSRRRRSVAIAVEPDSKVSVFAPRFLDSNSIERIVKKRKDWIFKKQEYFKKIQELFPPKEFVSGEKFPLLGRQYRLKVVKIDNGSVNRLSVEGRRIFVNVSRGLNKNSQPEEIKELLKNWYLSEANRIISERVKRYGNLVGVSPKSVKIKEHKSRWGSCSPKGNLHFNWKIVMAPISVVDYVVVHEICHLKMANHSARFWDLVSSIIQDYKLKREWFKNNSIISF